MRRLIGGFVGFVLLVVVLIRARYGGGDPVTFPIPAALRDSAELQIVAKLPLPPCNIAVSADGRVFFTFHPEARPDVNVAELVDGIPVPFPDAAFNARDSALHFQSVQSLRIDRQGRLWALDHGRHGSGQPRLLAFDPSSKRLIHRYDFPSAIAPLGSQLNDFQLDPSGRFVFIADASIFRKSPALVVYDIESRRSRRVLADHRSVTAERKVVRVDGHDVVVLGIFAIRPNVDSFVLDQDGTWLYYAPTTNAHMYRIQASALRDFSLSDQQLGARVETFGPKPPSDGLAIDRAGTIYITNPDASAINSLNAQRELSTQFQSPLLSWPDGLSFGPDNWLYVTNSSLHRVLMKDRDAVLAAGPYTILRFKVSQGGVPGQ